MLAEDTIMCTDNWVKITYGAESALENESLESFFSSLEPTQAANFKNQSFLGMKEGKKGSVLGRQWSIEGHFTFSRRFWYVLCKAILLHKQQEKQSISDQANIY